METEETRTHTPELVAFKTSLEEWKHCKPFLRWSFDMPFKTSLEEWKQQIGQGDGGVGYSFKTSLEEWKLVWCPPVPNVRRLLKLP